MTYGKLEVLLVDAKGLDNADFLCDMDPFVILTCRSQEQKSSVSSGGSTPEWNETFLFTISGDTPELNVKIFDKDTFTADDLVGEAIIPLEAVFESGSHPPSAYNVVKDGEFKGEIRIGLKFTPEAKRERGFAEEEFGGWKQSSQD